MALKDKLADIQKAMEVKRDEVKTAYDHFEEKKKELLAYIAESASKGFRTIGLAYRDLPRISFAARFGVNKPCEKVYVRIGVNRILFLRSFAHVNSERFERLASDYSVGGEFVSFLE